MPSEDGNKGEVVGFPTVLATFCCGRNSVITVEIESYLHGDKRMRIGGKETECLWKDCFPLMQERFSLTQATFLSDGSNVSL